MKINNLLKEKVNLIHFLKQASDYQGLQEKLNQLVSILNKAYPTVEELSNIFNCSKHKLNVIA